MLQTETPQYIGLHPSRLLLFVYLVITLVVQMALWQAALPLVWHIAASVLLLVYVTYLIIRYGLLRHPLSVVGLSYQASQDDWTVYLKNKQMLSVSVTQETRVTRFCVLLQLQSSHRRHVAIVMADSVTPCVFRRLRAYLLLR